MMVIFPKWLITILISGSIAMTAVAATTLIILLIRDYKGGKIW